jgi:hypothetical protein
VRSGSWLLRPGDESGVPLRRSGVGGFGPPPCNTLGGGGARLLMGKGVLVRHPPWTRAILKVRILLPRLWRES